MAEDVVVLDNGGASLKAGFAREDHPTRVFPNATAKVKGERQVLIGDQILSCTDFSSLTLKRPIDRGYVVNWDLEKLIWSRAFKSVLQCSPKDCGLVLTEPYLNLPVLQAQMDQVVFEDFQFRSYLPASSAELALKHWAYHRPDLAANRGMTGLLIDCGFSYTHVAPVFDGSLLTEAVQRINLGGKALTNHLKELVSFRSVNMMEETYLMEHIKEISTFVSQDLAKDLVIAKKGGHKIEYVLPDGVTNGIGHLRTPLSKEQQREHFQQGTEVPALQMNNERFLVPELIFQPSNVGLQQAGLAEAVHRSINLVHPDLRPALYSNILCTGGTAMCPGFGGRVAQEIRPLAPAELQVSVFTPSSPHLTAWQGGSLVGGHEGYGQVAFTKAEYEEKGSLNMRQ